MKKTLLFLALSAFGMSVWADQSLTPATFEDITVDADSLYRSDKSTENGSQTWKSGSFTFATYVDAGFAPAVYYYDVAVSAKKAVGFVADYTAGYDMKSAAGGAAVGNNYAVWYNNYYGNAKVALDSRAQVSGMYVCNNTYAVHSMQNGDSFAKKFEQDDWFKLTITGYQDAAAVGTVDFYLADFRTEGQHKIVTEWTWCDLTSLGEVDAISFALTSSDTGDYGMNTPAYFCFDELGANAATGCASVKSNVQKQTVRKCFVDGQIVIERNGHLYNLSGTQIR